MEAPTTYSTFTNQSALIKQLQFFQFTLDFSLNSQNNVYKCITNKQIGNTFTFDNYKQTNNQKIQNDMNDINRLNNNKCKNNSIIINSKIKQSVYNYDKHELLLQSFVRPLEIFFLIPNDVKQLILLYFKEYKLVFVANGGLNCGISCISTAREEHKLINFKLYDINTVNSNNKTPSLTTTFMNQWDANTMKLCVGKDINISNFGQQYKYLCQKQNRNEYDILFKAQKISNNAHNNYHFNYHMSGILINPLNILYYDIQKKRKRNNNIRVSNDYNCYHDSIKLFEFTIPETIATNNVFDMIYSNNNGLLTISNGCDIHSLSLNNKQLNKQKWKYLTQMPQIVRQKTHRTLQIISNENNNTNEQLFIYGGANLNNISYCNKAFIYNFNHSQWNEINSLNYGKSNAKSYFCTNSKQLFVGGGKEYKTSDIIEMFDMNKYNNKWKILPNSIFKHNEKVSIYMNELIAPQLLYIISQNGKEFYDLRVNKWYNYNNQMNYNVLLNDSQNVVLTL